MLSKERSVYGSIEYNQRDNYIVRCVLRNLLRYLVKLSNQLCLHIVNQLFKK